MGGVVAGTMVLTYTVGSSAAVFNQTGVRNFCSSDDGVIHFNSPAGQSTPVTTAAACQAFTEYNLRSIGEIRCSCFARFNRLTRTLQISIAAPFLKS